MAETAQEIQETVDELRLQILPPLVYETMSRVQRLKFILWYQQTEEGRDLFQRYSQSALEAIIAAFPTEAPADDGLKESLAKSFKSYVQKKWSMDGKRPPQPGSYFMFHKKFSEADSIAISLKPLPTKALNVMEISRVYDQGLATIITAVGARELHFHELCRTERINAQNSCTISMEGNSRYFLSAIAEFKELNTTEVWFRRARNGTPQFIFCPAVPADVPVLPLPLSQPGQTKAALDLSRLESMPPLIPERFTAEHKDGFYQWLLANNKFHIEDEDPKSLKFAPLLSELCSDDFHISDPKIPEARSLYLEYVKEMWKVPHKDTPVRQSVYLFERGAQFLGSSWISLTLELMKQVSSLILSTEELEQLAHTNVLPVIVSIYNGISRMCEDPGVLERDARQNWMLNITSLSYRNMFPELGAGVEVWFHRTQEKPIFIIRPEAKMPLGSI